MIIKPNVTDWIIDETKALKEIFQSLAEGSGH